MTELVLSSVHIRMLEADEFHIDGWYSPRGKQAAAELEHAGYIKAMHDGSDDQYTVINYKVTAEGKRKLAQL